MKNKFQNVSNQELREITTNATKSKKEKLAALAELFKRKNIKL